MKKAIIAISGSSEGKKCFSEIAKRTSWLWELNPINNIIDVTKVRYYWDGKRNDKVDEFLFEHH